MLNILYYVYLRDIRFMYANIYYTNIAQKCTLVYTIRVCIFIQCSIKLSERYEYVPQLLRKLLQTYVTASKTSQYICFYVFFIKISKSYEYIPQLLRKLIQMYDTGSKDPQYFFLFYAIHFIRIANFFSLIWDYWFPIS